MRRRSKIAGIGAAVLALSMVGAVPALAAYEEPPIGVCVPSEAWDETVIDQPFVPAVPGVPAVPEVPEISHTEIRVITAAYDRVVVDREAWDEVVFDHWQRYSWTGGPHASDEPPAFPSDAWQANVQGDPHGIGVAGAYYRSHGGSGNGDWFYLQAENTLVHHPAVTHLEHVPAVTEEVTVIDQEHVPGVAEIPGIPAIAEVSHVVHHPAVVCPPPRPEEPAAPTPTVTTAYGEWVGPLPTCDALEVEQSRTVTVTTTTHGCEWNAETWEWVATSTPSDVVTQETRTLAYEGECSITDPGEVDPGEVDSSVVEQPVVEPVAAATSGVRDTLAATGGALNPVVPVAGVLAVLLGGTASALKPRRQG